MLFSWFCIAHLATTRATASDVLCIASASEASELLNSSCDAHNRGRGLLQTSSERHLNAAFAAGEEAVPTMLLEQMAATKTASAQGIGRQGVSTAAGNGRVHTIKGLLSFGRGITSVEEHIATRSPGGDFEELLDPRLVGPADEQDPGYVMTTSVGDVSSVFTMANGNEPHRRLLLIANSVGVVRDVGLVAVVIIIVVSILIVLLAGFAGSRSDAEQNEVFSSDSEKFGAGSRYKSKLSPKMPGRTVKAAEPVRVVQAQPNDQFSPAPAMRPSVQASSRPSFNPATVPRESGRGSSPFAPEPKPYQMQPQPPPPTNTQMPVDPFANAPPPANLGTRPSNASQGSSSRHLCPGLVVPKGSECVLAVPTLRALNVPPRNTAAFFVRDLGGKPVIQAEILVQPWSALGGGVGQRPIAVLRTAIAQGDEPATISDLSPLLAYVKASFEAGGRRSAYVYDARDEIFAHVAKDPFRSCYVLTSSRMGVQVIFSGSFHAHTVHVTNEARESLAEVEPCTVNFDSSGDYYKIRVVSHVDVGLILCGLLAIEHMEASS